MAEDVDINAEEGSIDEAEQSEVKKSFFKSKLFFIIAGVIVLFLLAGAAYYFFVATEEGESEDIASTTEVMGEEESTDLIEESEVAEDGLTSMAEQMGFEQASSDEAEGDANLGDNETSAAIANEDTSKELVEVQQQNLRMKQQVDELEAKLNQIESMLQSQKNITGDAADLPLQYPDDLDYQQAFNDNSTMRAPSPPPPKPSWGEFDRINKK